MQRWNRIWTDADLYAKYQMTPEEVQFIEKVVRPLGIDGAEQDEQVD